MFRLGKILLILKISDGDIASSVNTFTVPVITGESIVDPSGPIPRTV